MSVKLFSSVPSNVLAGIKLAIKDGHIKTWKHSIQHGKDHFTHTTPDKQWEDKAWFVPSIESDKLTFHIVSPQGGKINRAVFSVYHGRFIEMAIEHVSKQFSVARATANADDGDIV